EGQAVFVGYGIEKGPEPDYAAYSSFKEGDDLKGKVAVLLRFEPLTENGVSQFAVGAWSPAASIQKKLATVIDRGAAAVVVGNPPGVSDRRGTALQTTAQPAGNMGKPQEVPIAMISQERADQLVRAGDGLHRSLEDLRKLADAGGGVIPLPGVKVTV